MSAKADEVESSSTPYLDLLKPLPRQNAAFSEFKIWQVVVFLLCLGLKTVRLFYGILLAIIFAHEIGHTLGGLVVGDRFEWVRVGPLTIGRGGKPRWKWNWMMLFTGAAWTIPVSKVGLRWKLLISTLAGPAANFASAWLVSLVIPDSDSMLAGIGKLFVIGSVVVSLLNMIPFQRHGVISDGMRVWLLLFDKRRRERLIFVMTFVSDAKQGLVQEPLADGSLERLTSLGDASADHTVANYAAYKIQTNQAAAAQYLENCLAKCNGVDPEFREELIVEAAKYQVFRRHRPDLARDWLALEKSGKPRLNRYFAEALILVQEKQLEAAIAKIDETLVFIEKTFDGRLREGQIQAFEKWRGELQKQVEASSVPLPSSD